MRSTTNTLRKLILHAASGLLMTPVLPTAIAAETSQQEMEEVVVTGSRIERDGATPVTTVNADLLDRQGSVNIADTLNRLPAFQDSVTPQDSSPRARNTGVNFLNLRSLGANRTLVLVDGNRHVPSTEMGSVDLNLIPSLLIDRAEVVTGGASAAYGSDAVAGVVNLILKRDIQGVRTDVQFGKSEVGDNTEYRVSILAGSSFANERGHAALALDYLDNDGVEDPYSRNWGRKEYGQVANPVSGALPVRTIASDVHQSSTTFAGLITSGPLRGTQFNADGSIGSPFVFGALAGNQLMIGGDGSGQRAFHGVGLRAESERKIAYLRTDYRLTDDVELFFDASYGSSRGIGDTPLPFDFGSITIQQDNAFLPESLRATMVANNIQTFRMGRLWLDFGNAHGDATNATWRGIGGLRGGFGDVWSWDASVQYGENEIDQKLTNSFILARKNQALDAVVAPNGSIVCRSTLTNPGNGCQPFNPFGVGHSSPEAFDWLRATQQFLQTYKQTTAAANLRGRPFELWAGPFSLATGLEYREEELQATADALGLADSFAFGNYKRLDGIFDVKEAYLEVDVPLIAGASLAKAFNLNGAIRYTDYSTSGDVNTWKAGVTWDVIDELRLRATSSRDIRAPNISELFSQPRTTSSSVLLIDPFRNNATGLAISRTAGNPNLTPEEADAFTAGIVYQPSWASDLRVAVDYYDIELNGAVLNLSPQAIVDRCFDGESAPCAMITRNGLGVITQIDAMPINIGALRTRGIDVELDYGLAALGGDLSFRLFATHSLRDEQSNGEVVTDTKGQNAGGIPDWAGTAIVGYVRNRLSLTVEGQYFSDGTLNNTFVEGVDINDNSLPSMFYTNLSLQYDLGPSGKEFRVRVFAVVDNLFDRDPASVPEQSGPPPGGVPAGGMYDVIGRTYRAGVRLQF